MYNSRQCNWIMAAALSSASFLCSSLAQMGLGNSVFWGFQNLFYISIRIIFNLACKIMKFWWKWEKSLGKLVDLHKVCNFFYLWLIIIPKKILLWWRRIWIFHNLIMESNRSLIAFEVKEPFVWYVDGSNHNIVLLFKVSVECGHYVITTCELCGKFKK